MAEYFHFRTDTGLSATRKFTTWEDYLRFNEGQLIDGEHRVTFVTTLYDASDYSQAIIKGKIRERYYAKMLWCPTVRL